jgi:pimeloyl-ACP methyl ester carboxylesterase
VATSVLEIGYEAHGPVDGPAAVLLHGFPYDARSYDEVSRALAARGMRAVVPYLRGYGPTRFRDPATPRSGEQAALGNDLIELVEALGLDRPVVAGYDWGGRAACVAAARRPELFAGLVTVTGYNIFGRPTIEPLEPAAEHLLWYQYYLHLDRGRQMLEDDRRGFCRYLWTLWSPTWDFSEEVFAATAESFDNPDFVDVVLHSYRHRSGLVVGDPALAPLARWAETRPSIGIPTVVLHGEEDMAPLAASLDRSRFTGSWRRRVVPGTGHNLPQEDPRPVVEAVLDLAGVEPMPAS